MTRGFPAGSVSGKEVLGIHKLTLRSSGQGHGLQRLGAGLGRPSGSSARGIHTVVPGPPPGVVPEPAAKPVPTPTTSVAVATWWHVMVHGRCASWMVCRGVCIHVPLPRTQSCCGSLQRRSAALCVSVGTFCRLVGGLRERLLGFHREPWGRTGRGKRSLMSTLWVCRTSCTMRRTSSNRCSETDGANRRQRSRCSANASRLSRLQIN